MTNVPDNLREMWADIYRLFDINYKMENNETAWTKFWNQATAIGNKYGNNKRLIEMVTIVSEMIEDRMKKDAENATKTPIESHPCTLEDMNLF